MKDILGPATKAVLVFLVLLISTSFHPIHTPANKTTEKNLPDLQLVHKLDRIGYTSGVTWSSDSTRLAAYSTFGEDLVTVWDNTGAILQQFDRLGIADIGEALAFVGGNKQIVMPPAKDNLETAAFSVFDVGSGDLVREMPASRKDWRGRRNWTIDLASSPDQSILAAAFVFGVQLYSTKDWSRISDIPLPSLVDRVSALAFSQDGKRLAVGLNLDVLIFDIAEKRVMQHIRAFSLEEDGCCVSAVSFNPDASLIAVSTEAQPSGHCDRDYRGRARCEQALLKTPIRVFRVKDGSEAVSYPQPLWSVWDMRWSVDGQFIAFSTSGALHLWNPAHPQEHATIDLYGQVISLAFSPNNKWLGVCNGTAVKIFRITTQNEMDKQ